MGNIFTMCCGSIDPPFDRKVRSVIDPLVLSPDHEESERMKRILKKRQSNESWQALQFT
jgi:hypothetical protein